MTFARSKVATTAVWTLALLVMAAISRPSSASDIGLLSAIAIAGFVVLWWLWKRPDETMSESIQNARR